MQSLRNSLRNFANKYGFLSLLGFALLLLQVLSVLNCQFSETKYLCWAPHTKQIYFKLSVNVNDRTLTEQESCARYKFWDCNWEVHALGNLLEVIKERERIYAQNEKVEVQINYQTNGQNPQRWIWKNFL